MTRYSFRESNSVIFVFAACTCQFLIIIRAATIYRYTGKLRFALNKYRIAVHFWLYRYINLPFVSTYVHFPLKFAKKASIIVCETDLKLSRFLNRKQYKRCGGIICDTNIHTTTANVDCCHTEYRRLSSIARC